MSKLDDIIARHHCWMCAGHAWRADKVPTEIPNDDDTKQQIKSLIDEILGVRGLADGKTGAQLWKEISERAEQLL